MRTISQILAVSIVVTFVTYGSAECNRGSQGRASPANRLTSMSRSSPLISEGLVSAAQMQNQLAQQRYMLAMQQRMRQANVLARNGSGSNSGQSRTRSRSSGLATTRRDQLRLQNAEKMMQTAVALEVRGNNSSAEKTYRKVMRIVGSRTDLGRQAFESLARLRDDNDGSRNAVAFLASSLR